MTMTNRQKKGSMTGVLGRSYSLWGISVAMAFG